MRPRVVIFVVMPVIVTLFDWFWTALDAPRYVLTLYGYTFGIIAGMCIAHPTKRRIEAIKDRFHGEQTDSVGRRGSHARRALQALLSVLRPGRVLKEK